VSRTAVLAKHSRADETRENSHEETNQDTGDHRCRDPGPGRNGLGAGGRAHYYGHHGMMGGWVGGMLMMLLMIALIVGAVVLTLRLLGLGPTGRSSGRALDILNERLARGEIDRAEYEDRRRALQDGDSR
jgi:putative membrane protein